MQSVCTVCVWSGFSLAFSHSESQGTKMAAIRVIRSSCLEYVLANSKVSQCGLTSVYFGSDGTGYSCTC